jgi:hypothetical protein
MIQKQISARTMRRLILSGILLCACFAAARASVIPRVCVDMSYRTGSVTLASATAVGAYTLNVNGYVPPFTSLIINPGGENQETVPYVNVRIDGSNPYTIALAADYSRALNPNAFVIGDFALHLSFSHEAGETVTFAGYSGRAYFGYNNTGNTTVVFPKGILTKNYFTPGPATNIAQPTTFQPGIYDNVFSISIGGKATDTFNYFLDDNSVSVLNSQNQNCAAINYQGKLSNAGAAANGNYDFQFVVFDALTGGAAQSSIIAANNIAVTNGVFTAPLNFGSTFIGNNNARFLEIAVRPAGSTEAFTILTPRQPITDAPFAINAQRAFSVSGGFVQLPLTTNVPLTSDCNQASKYGQTRVDAVNNRLYICTSTGWKFTALQ